MIKTICTAILFAGLLSCSSDQNVAKVKKESVKGSTIQKPGIDIAKSTIRWTATKAIGGGHSGTVSFLNGDVSWENGKPVKGLLEVDMNSITCSDIKDVESNTDLVNHLKSPDFFSVEEFPTVKVKILGLEEIKEDFYKAPCDITIKGIEKQVVADLKLSEMNGVKVLKGAVVIDRTEFGVVYNSSNFFKSLGDKVINDEVRLRFNLFMPQ